VDSVFDAAFRMPSLNQTVVRTAGAH